MREKRSLNHAYLLDEIALLAGRHLIALLLGFGAVIVLVAAALHQVPDVPDGLVVSPDAESVWRVVAVVFVLAPLPGGVLALLIRDTVAGDDGRHPAVLDRFLERWPRLLGLGLAVGLPTLIGFTPSVLPGVIYLTMFAAALPALMLEDRSVLGAMRRSLELTRGFRVDVGFLLLSLMVLAGLPLLGILATIDALAFTGTIDASLWLPLVFLGLAPLFPVAGTVLYLHLRALHEIDVPEEEEEDDDCGFDWTDSDATIDLDEEGEAEESEEETEQYEEEEAEEEEPEEPDESPTVAPTDLHIGDVLRHVFRAAVAWFPVTVTVYALFWGPVGYLLIAHVCPAIGLDPDARSVDTFLFFGMLAFLAPIPTAALSVMTRDMIHGRKISISRCWLVTCNRIGTLLPLCFLAGFVPYLGVVCGALPGCIYLMATFVAVPAAVFEDLGCGAALARSVWLTRRHRGNVIVVVFLGALAIAVVYGLCALGVQSRGIPGLGRISGTEVAGALSLLYLIGIAQGAFYDALARVKAIRPDLEAEHAAFYFRFDEPPD